MFVCTIKLGVRCREFTNKITQNIITGKNCDNVVDLNLSYYINALNS